MRALLSLSWLALAIGVPEIPTITWDLRDTSGNLIKDRQQWQKNDGYCGETSFIMAGMHLAGQYVSEYDVRAAANPSLSDRAAQAHQLLIGDVGSTDTNDKAASDKLKLRYAFYSPTTPSTGNVGEYLGWIKAQLRRGRAPTICVYCKDCGNVEYDHIVTAISYESTSNDDLFHPGDAFTYCDHLGAYPSGNADDGDYTASDWQAIAANGGIDASSCTRIVVNSLSDPFFGSRADADARTSYTMPDDVRNYGIAHLGPVDLDNELLRVEMTSDKTFEAPEIQTFSVGNGARPASMDLTLTITVSGLSTDPTKQYVLCLACQPGKEPSTVRTASFSPALFSPPRCPSSTL
jgi:hypothetical protein